MGDYAASIKGLANILKEFPDTPHKEEILFLVVKSYYKYAKESIEERQKDRHSKVVIAYNEFVAQYPESKFAGEAADLKERSKKELEALTNKDQKKLNRKEQEFNQIKSTK